MKLENHILINLKPEDVESACRHFICTCYPHLANGFTISPSGSVPSLKMIADGGEWIPTSAMLTKSTGIPGFSKADPKAPLFVTQGNKLHVRSGAIILVDSARIAFCGPKEIPLPTLVPGTDYHVYLKSDGTFVVDKFANFAEGFKCRMIGGFHVDLTGAILPNSLWDLKYRCGSDDQEGLALFTDPKDGSQFWGSAYFLGTDCRFRANNEIADGYEHKPLGYDSLSYHAAVEILAKKGLRPPTRRQFEVMAQGSTPGKTTGKKPLKTEIVPGLTSDQGMVQATGALFCWLLGPHDVHGEDYRYVGGGAWGFVGYSGPGFLGYGLASFSSGGVGVRACGDHLILD